MHEDANDLRKNARKHWDDAAAKRAASRTRHDRRRFVFTYAIAAAAVAGILAFVLFL